MNLPELYSFAPKKIQALALMAAGNGWSIGIAVSGGYWILTLIDKVACVSIHAEVVTNGGVRMSYFYDLGEGQKKVSKAGIESLCARKAYV